MSKKRRTPADEPFLTIRTASATFSDGASLPPHSHPWGQLSYAITGVLSVWSPEGSWVAPPNWAIWTPPTARHAMRFTGTTWLRTLYVRPDLPGLPQTSTVIIVSALLRELVIRIVARGMLDSRSELDRALASLVIAELREHPAASLELPRPTSASLNRLAEYISATPGAAHSHHQLARRFNLSVRTLERAFLDETGLTLGRWRRQVRLLHAVRRLGAGAAVKVAAADAGYASASAFIAAFRAGFGTTPAQYFKARPVGNDAS